jgi:hypothetical protein
MLLLMLLLLLIYDVSLSWTPELTLALLNLTTWVPTVLTPIAEISLSLLRSVWAEIRIVSV